MFNLGLFYQFTFETDDGSGPEKNISLKKQKLNKGLFYWAIPLHLFSVLLFNALTVLSTVVNAFSIYQQFPHILK